MFSAGVLRALWLLALVKFVLASPIDRDDTSPVALPPLLKRYTLAPFTFLKGTDDSDPFDASKNAFNHYFKPEDQIPVTNAFEALINAVIAPTYYNVRCADATQADCSDIGTASFAFAQQWPEDYEVPDHITKGQRQLVICPLFWTADQTKRDLPRTTDQVTEWCSLKESKKYADWETGAHTILHEITHLDEWGKLAQFPTLNTPADDPYPAYDAHGTEDWKNICTAANARILRNTQAKNPIPRWQNAESLAGFALEWAVFKQCGVTDVLL